MTRIKRRTARAMTIWTTILLIATMVLLVAMVSPALAGAKTELVSKSSGGVKGNGASGEPSSSASGRYIAFNSAAEYLVPNDTNGRLDCFVRDMVANKVERVSVATDGDQTNGRCFGPAISPDGRWVAFESNASDLDGPSNGFPQIYLRDLQQNTTTMVTRNGSLPGNLASVDPAISNNGRFVAFESQATNLVDGGTNGKRHIFLWDRLDPGNIRLVSRHSNGTQGNKDSHDPAISAWGKFIVFDSLSSNLVGRDGNGRKDVFLHNRVSHKTSIVSINSKEKRGNGASSNASVSASGRWVAFESRARNMTPADRTNGPDVFVRDRKKGKTIQASVTSSGRQVGGWSGDPTISNNGRYIAFESTAGDLVSKDPNGKRDVFLRDRVGRTTKLVSRRGNGKPAWGGDSVDAWISGNGRFVTFESKATKIVIKDKDKTEDVFRRGPLR